MDGNGSIQVNHCCMKSLQYRLIIKLSNLQSNYNMLLKIAITIGGSVRIVKNKKEVLWVVDNKKTILEIIDIFMLYPPLTLRLICQLKFLKICLKNNSVKDYLDKRKLKYNDQLNIIKLLKTSCANISYFPSWLSGFIEAQGCFSIGKKKKNHSFFIVQNIDFYILQKIKEFFDLRVMVRNPNKKFFIVECFKKESLYKIVKHCTSYPLLGEKSLTLKKFIKYIQ